MSKKNKNNNKSREITKTETKAYDLHTDAVERLASADDKAPEYTDEELNKYNRGFLNKIPLWVKALFVKFWFNGAICYFFVWGLGAYIGNTIDMLVVLALAMGMFNSLIVNNVMLFLDDGSRSYSRWLFVPQRDYEKKSDKVIWALASFFFDIIYAGLIVFFVYLIYFGVNRLTEGNAYVEPIVFGLLYLGVDLIFIGMKNLAVGIIRDAVNKKQDG